MNLGSVTVPIYKEKSTKNELKSFIQAPSVLKKHPFSIVYPNNIDISFYTEIMKENQILLSQNYSTDDDRRHIQPLVPYFKDSRYIRINNKPIIAIYRSTIIPNIEETLKTWREEAKRHNIELYICRFESWGKAGEEDLTPGFDAAIEFSPFSSMGGNRKFFDLEGIKKDRFFYHPINKLFSKINNKYHIFQKYKYKNSVFEYNDLIDTNKKTLRICNYKLFACCCPGWDNTPRRKKNRIIVKNNNPESFGSWFKFQTEYTIQKFDAEEQLIFINAWNEWAEGNHLEPCQKWGKAFLQQIKYVTDNLKQNEK